MSHDNVKIVRGLLDAWNRGDHDAWIEGFAEDCEFRPLRAQLEGRAYRGHDDLRRFADDLAEDWAQLRFAPSEIREVGDMVLVLARFQARGRASGAELDVPVGVLGKLRDGRIVEARFFSDPDDARTAAGLAE